MVRGDLLAFARRHAPVWLGFALFTAVNATVTMGGFFPLFSSDFQTPSMHRAFSAVMTLAFVATMGIAMLAARRPRRLVETARVVMVALPYGLGWAALVAAMYLPRATASLVFSGAALIGVGSAGFLLLWVAVFAAQRQNTANRLVVLGTFVAPVVYYVLCLIPSAVTDLLIPLVFLPVICLCLVLARRQERAELAARQAKGWGNRPEAFRAVLIDYLGSALCISTISFSCAALRSLALGMTDSAMALDCFSMLVTLVVMAVVLFFWQTRELSLSIDTVFRFLFPVIMTALVLLPFLGERYVPVLESALYALYVVASAFVVIQAAQAARERSVNSTFVYGYIVGIIQFAYCLGFLTPLTSEKGLVLGLSATTLIAIVCIYLVALMYFVAMGGFRSAVSPSRAHVAHAELFTTAAKPKRERASSGGPVKEVAEEGRPAPASQESTVSEGPAIDAFHDKLAMQSALLASRFALSDRERDVVNLLVRGRTIAEVAETLAISANTVRTHTKSIYAKLDIHKKRELIDLVQSYNPSALRGGG